MSLDSYIKREKDYLNQESRKFVETFPQVSQFLSEPSFDPDVNRVLDGFAYLSSLLHAKVDHEYPQLSANLMDMLWPNYLQSTPSMSVVEFHSQQPHCVEVPSQAQVLSRVTTENPLPCTFTTTRHTWVIPFALNKVVKASRNSIDLYFTHTQLSGSSSGLQQGTVSQSEISQSTPNLLEAGIDKLRLFLGADTLSRFQLYLYFARYLSSVTLWVNEQRFVLADATLAPVGFDPQDAILKYPSNTYTGYRMLHEYFCFTEGFLFFDLMGLPEYLDRLPATDFRLEFTFKQPLPAMLKLSPSSIKINCAPVINLFTHDSEPIRLTGTKTEYPLYLSHQQPEHYELFAIEQVQGWVNKRSRYYTEFDRFSHQTDVLTGDHSRYYHLHRRGQDKSEQIRYLLSFVRGDEASLQNQSEVISVRALCSNCDAAQTLRIGDICVAAEGIPEGISVSNVIYPSAVVRPNLDPCQQWTMISSLSLNYLSLLDKNSLCQILQNYNFTARYSARAAKSLTQLLECIESFESVPHQQYYRDLIISGHKSTLRLSPAAFNDSGEMYLFGAVIAEFYSLYASVNSFHCLELINSSTHETFQWPLMNQ